MRTYLCGPGNAMASFPKLDVEKVAKSIKVKSVLYDDTKRSQEQPKAFYAYVIWKYSKLAVTRCELSDELSVHIQTLGRILRYYNVAPYKRLPKFLDWKYPELECDFNFQKQCKKLYDSGLNTYKKIADALNVDSKTIKRIARRDGWLIHTRQIKWEISDSLPKCDLNTYKQYCRTVRHYTNKIYETYKYLIDPRGLKGFEYHIDHKLSVYDAYNRGQRPIPWQMVIHPANLILKTRQVNQDKGKHSDFSPKQLHMAIKNFEEVYGAVKIPIFLVNESNSNFVYTDGSITITNKIVEASTFTLLDLKKLSKKNLKCPELPKRSHLKRSHYKYIINQLLIGKRQQDVATALGCSTNMIKWALTCIGLPSHMQVKRFERLGIVQKILKHASEEYKISETANELDLDKFTTLYLYLRFKEN